MYSLTYLINILIQNIDKYLTSKFVMHPKYGNWNIYIGISNISEAEFKKPSPHKNKQWSLEHNMVGNILTSLFEDTNLFKEEKILEKDSENLDYEIEISKKTAKKLIQTLKKLRRVHNQILKLKKSLAEKRNLAKKFFGVPARANLSYSLLKLKNQYPYSFDYIHKQDWDAVISALESSVVMMKTTINLRWKWDKEAGY